MPLNKYNLSQIKQHPNILSKFYKEFNVATKYLFTGHSHQAWPNCSIEGQKAAWLDAAKHVDDKWDLALKKAESVKDGFSRLLEDQNGYIALAPNTHDLLIRLLSGLDFRKRNCVITTDCEFHTVRRQLSILSENNYINLIKVSGHPTKEVILKILSQIDNNTAIVIISAVYFNSGQIVEGFAELLEQTEKFGAKLLIDVYHALNVVPFSISELKLDQAYIIGGGYKYCQLGEGNAFLRFPRECKLKPVISGWFGEWSDLSEAKPNGPIKYGAGGYLFAGSTYDPTSHYRAATVFDFFKTEGLNPIFLRAISQHQIKMLRYHFNLINSNPNIIYHDNDIPLEKIGGFLVLETFKAKEICSMLRNRGVLVDYRNTNLRFGPAPYISDEQIVVAMQILKEIIDEWQDKWLMEL